MKRALCPLGHSPTQFKVKGNPYNIFHKIQCILIDKLGEPQTNKNMFQVKFMKARPYTSDKEDSEDEDEEDPFHEQLTFTIRLMATKKEDAMKLVEMKEDGESLELYVGAMRDETSDHEMFMENYNYLKE